MIIFMYVDNFLVEMIVCERVVIRVLLGQKPVSCSHPPVCESLCVYIVCESLDPGLCV